MADGKAQIVLSAVDRTGPAFQAALRNMNALKAEAGAIVGRLTPIAAAVAGIAGAAGVFSIKGVVDTADQLSKLSERTGIAVEDLSALRFAGELSDVSLDELGESLKRLNLNVASAARGVPEQAEAFKALGVSVKDAAGNVRSADAVLGDIADKFSGMADGANKVALANAIGGKSFEKLIPLLNGGRQGLAEAREELEKFGGVMSGDLAKKSAEFNDNITKLGIGLEGLKVQLAGGVVEKLAELTGIMVEGAKGGSASGVEGFTQAVNTAIEAMTVLGANVSFVFKGVGREIGAIAAQALALARLDINGFNAISDAVKADAEQARKELEALERRILNLNKVRILTDVAPEGDRSRSRVFNSTDKPDAPALPDPGAKSAADRAAAEALSTLNKITEGRVKRAQGAAQEEQDVARHREQILRGIYELGESSLSEFYSRQDTLRRQNLESTKRAITEEITAREAQLASPLLKGPDKASEREDIKNKITEAKSKLGDADREFAQAEESASVERRRATRELLEQVTEIDVRIKALAGDDAGAAMLENARQVAEARRLLTQQGGDPAKADQLAAALDLQTRFNAAQKEFGQLSAQAANAEDRLAIAARTGGKGLIQNEDDLRDARQSALAQLGSLIARTEEFAANSKDPSVLQYLDDLKLRYEQLAEVQDPRKIRLDAAADNIGDAIADGFERAVVQGEKLSDVLKGIGNQIASIVTKELVTKPLAEGIANFVKGAGGQGLGENLIGYFMPKQALPKQGDANFVGPLPQGALPAPAAEQSIIDRVLGFVGLGPKSVAAKVTGFGGGTLADAKFNKPAPVFSPQGANASLETLRQASDAAAQALQRIANTTAPGAAPASEGGLLPTGDFARADRAGLPAAAETAEKGLEGTADSAQQTSAQVDIFGTGMQTATQLLSLFGKETTAATLALRLMQALQGTGSSDGGFGKFFSGLFGGSSGSAGGTNASDGALALFFHGGGVVGEGTDARIVSMLPRYHTGGLAGLAADQPAGLKDDETLAVLLKNEEVLTKDDPRHRDNLPSQVFERVLSMKDGATLAPLLAGTPATSKAAPSQAAVAPSASILTAATESAAQAAAPAAVQAVPATPAAAAVLPQIDATVEMMGAAPAPVLPAAPDVSVQLASTVPATQPATPAATALPPAAPATVAPAVFAALPDVSVVAPDVAVLGAPAVFGVPAVLQGATQIAVESAAAGTAGAPGPAGAPGVAGAPASASAEIAAAAPQPLQPAEAATPPALAVLGSVMSSHEAVHQSLLQRFATSSELREQISTGQIDSTLLEQISKTQLESVERYHTGGIAGLKADPVGLKANETLAVLLKNEEVLTHDDPRHRNNLPDRVFERVMAMKEGASLSSLAGFDMSGLQPSQIISREASDRSTDRSTDRLSERSSDSTHSSERIHERLLQRFDSSELQRLEQATHGQFEKLVESTSVWDEVERYHTGGIAGLKADEVPAVLRRGEEVLTQADPRHRENQGSAQGGRPVQINVQMPANATKQNYEQAAAAVGREVRVAMARGSAGGSDRR